MKISVTLNISDADLNNIKTQLRDDGLPHGDLVAELWCALTGAEAIGGRAWEQFYQGIADQISV